MTVSAAPGTMTRPDQEVSRSQRPSRRTSARSRVWYIYVLVAIWLIAVLGPFVWMLITALTPASQFAKSTASSLPAHPTLAAFGQLLTGTPFVHYVINSAIVAAATVVITVCVSVLAATALSRYRFRGRKALLLGILLVQLFPAVLLVEPIFSELKSLNLLDSLPGLFLVYATFASPFSTWLLKGFMDEIPLEVEEAARVDGCSTLQVFWYVLLPLTRPGIAAAGTYAFIYSWNEFIYAVTFTSGVESYTVPVGLSLFIGENTIRWELLTAGGVLAALPIVVGFMFVQKHLVAGLTSGAVKG
jgi:multiple sugar transport system permease protein